MGITSVSYPALLIVVYPLVTCVEGAVQHQNTLRISHSEACLEENVVHATIISTLEDTVKWYR